MAFKGTSLRHLSQIIADFKILLDGINNTGTKFTATSGYVKDREKELMSLIAEVGKSNIKLTGHSLGGTTSVILTLEHGLKGSGFNIGSAELNYNRYKQMLGEKKFYTYYVKDDVLTKSWVSNGSIYRKNNINKSIKQKCSNAHGINNFVPLKYLDDGDCKKS